MTDANRTHMTNSGEVRTSDVRRFRIVVGVDQSEYAEVILEHAFDQAARHDAPELHLVTVRERRLPSAEALTSALWCRVCPVLEAFNRWSANWHVQLHIRRGRPAEEIVALTFEVGADLVVMGRFGLHHKRAARSLSTSVLARSAGPVLIVGMGEPWDARQCPLCVAVRRESEGTNWFCDRHHGRDRASVTPMTVWSDGDFALEHEA